MSLFLLILWETQVITYMKDCIGLMQMPNTKTETVFVAIRNILIRVLCQLPIVDRGDVTPSLRIMCPTVARSFSSLRCYKHI